MRSNLSAGCAPKTNLSFEVKGTLKAGAGWRGVKAVVLIKSFKGGDVAQGGERQVLEYYVFFDNINLKIIAIRTK
jgi:hypothetical protein